MWRRVCKEVKVNIARLSQREQRGGAVTNWAVGLDRPHSDPGSSLHWMWNPGKFPNHSEPVLILIKWG